MRLRNRITNWLAGLACLVTVSASAQQPFGLDYYAGQPNPAGGGGAAAPAVYSFLSESNATTASTVSFTADAGSGANRLMLFYVVWFDSGGSRTIVPPTFNGVSASFITNASYFPASPTQDPTSLYGLIAPATGTHTAAVSWSGTVDLSGMAVIVLTNVNQTSPYIAGYAAAADSASGTSTLTYTGNAKSIGMGFGAIPDTQDDGHALTVGGSQTFIGSVYEGSGNVEGDVTTQLSASSFTDSWNYTVSVEKGIIGLGVSGP